MPTAAAQTRLSGATMLSALGIETLAATVLETGSAGGTAQLGNASFEVAATRLGKDASRVLVLTMPPPSEAPREQIAPQEPQDTTHDTTTAPPAAAQPEAVIAVPPDASPAAPAVEPPPAAADETVAERRHPLRFVWHMDAGGRFGVGSDEFIELAGPHTTAAFGRPWNEIAAELELDPNNQVARAVASRETWSGIVVSWPVDNSGERLPIEMSGLPVFDRDRSFRGYRGFGVCRDIERINQLARSRREHPIGFHAGAGIAAPARGSRANRPRGAGRRGGKPRPKPPAAEAASHAERPALVGVAPASANVVPFRPSPPAEPKVPPTLSPVERRAFRELAQELTARLRGPQEAPAAAESAAEVLPAETAETAPLAAPSAEPVIEQVLLNRIPIGVLVYRHDKLLYANRHFLEWSGYENLAAIEAAGGLNTLFAEPGADALAETAGANSPSIKSLSIMTQRGDKLPVEGRMFTVPWDGSSALALILTNGQRRGGGTRGRTRARCRREGKPRAQIDPRHGNRRRHYARCRRPHRRRQHPRRSPIRQIAGRACRPLVRRSLGARERTDRARPFRPHRARRGHPR